MARKGYTQWCACETDPAKTCRKMVVGSREVSGPEPREKNCRVLGVPKLSSIYEEQCELKPDPDQVGAVNASDKSPIVPNAETGSAISKDSKESGDEIFSDPEDVRSKIYALNPSTRYNSDSPVPVFPPKRVCLVRGERADYLSEFTRAVGGEVILDRRDHTAKIRLFGGSKAWRTRACTALLDTGSPASLIKENIWQEMIACGSGSDDGRTEVAPKTWGGFHGVPSSYVRLNVQLENIKKTDQGSVRSPTVCLVVFAHVVPKEAMTVDVLLGRDSWSHFPIRKYRDVSEKTTIVTFVTKTNGLASKEERYRKWINNAVGMMESKGKGRVIVRVANHNHKLPNIVSWLLVSLTNADGTEAERGAYCIWFGLEWSPQEAIVEAGISEIPIRRLQY